MLLYRSHWHFAFERDPFREARLLAFAADKDDALAEDKQVTSPMPETKSEKAAEEGLTEGAIQSFERAVRDQSMDVLDGLLNKRTPEDNENKKTLDQKIRKSAEAIETRAVQLESALLTLEKTIESEAVQQYLTDNKKLDEMREQTNFIRRQLEMAYTMQGGIADFTLWQKGALQPDKKKKQTPVDKYVTLMQTLYRIEETDTAEQKANKEAVMQALDAHIKKDKANINAVFTRPGHDSEETYEDIERWESAISPLTPKDFIAIIKNHFGPEKEWSNEERQCVKELEAFISNPKNSDTIKYWASQDKKTKTPIIEELCKIAKTTDIKSKIEKQREIREELNDITKVADILTVTDASLESQVTGMQAAEGMIREMANDFHREHHDTNDYGSSHFLFGVKFYSPLEVWEALKSVKEAYTTAWHDHSHHKSAALAKELGEALSWIPVFGETANIALKKEQESHNEKQKNEFKEYLKSNHFSFKEIFGQHDHDTSSLFHQAHHHHDGNKVRAILEYAASKGWLYDLDLSAGKSAKKVLGHDMADMMHDYSPHEVTNYFNALRGENSSGRDNEIKAAHDKVKDIENIPFFISEIEAEMKGCNLWAAIGIAQRAVERGLIGETIPWIMTTISRILRENPEVRAKASVDFYDKLGALSLYHSDATMGILKVARKDLYKWSQQSWKKNEQEKSDNAFAKLGTTLKVVQDIEESIRERTGIPFNEESGKYSKAQLDRFVAKVLASQVLTIDVEPGDHRKEGEHTFSIFEERYDYYTHKSLGQGDVNIAKEDEDYFRETTANLRADYQVVKEIFAMGSTGRFNNDARATNYAIGILELPESMEGKGLLKEAKNFRRTMGAKLKQWFKAEIIPSNDRAKAAMAFSPKGRPFLKELFRLGYIDIKFLEDNIRNNEGKEVSTKILKFVDPDNKVIKEEELKLEKAKDKVGAVVDKAAGKSKTPEEIQKETQEKVKRALDKEKEEQDIVDKAVAKMQRETGNNNTGSGSVA